MIVVTGSFAAFNAWCRDNHRSPAQNDVVWADSYERVCSLSLSRSEDFVVPLGTTDEQREVYYRVLTRYRRP